MKAVNTNTINNSSSNLDYNTQITNCTSNDLLRNDLGFINYSNNEKEYITSSYLELYRPLIENTLQKDSIDEYYKEVCKIYGYNQNIDNGVRDLENNIIITERQENMLVINSSVLTNAGTINDELKTNQDSYSIIENIFAEKLYIYGVFDGHGQNSEILSSFISNYIKKYFSDKKNYIKFFIII